MNSPGFQDEFPKRVASRMLNSHRPQPGKCPPTTNSGRYRATYQMDRHDISEATWEKLQEITTRFPDFIRHKDESVLEQEGIDTSEPTTHVAQQPSRPKHTTKKPIRYLE
ncbi:hypothetical protein Tco_0154874 [Tanacetum coccineum]